MSLKAWYPFNGDFINQGVGDLSLTQVTTPTYIDNGKFGKCLSAGAFKWSAAQTASILNNEEVSFSIWVYPSGDAGATSGCLFGTEGMTAPNNRKFTFFMYPTVNDLHWSWQNDADTTFTSGVLTGVFPNKTWTHLAITYKNPDGKIYINGVLKTSFTGISNSSSFAYETSVIANRANRYVSDFRIYDHCLSPKEVKELSKGLCLHYTLNNNGGGGDNILLGTNQGISNWSWSMQAGDSTKTEVIMDGVKCCKITRGSTAQSGWSYLFYSHLNYSAYKPSTVYTISMEVYPSVDTSFSFSNFMAGNATAPMLGNVKTIQGSVKANQWNKLIFQGTTLDTLPASGSQGVYFTVSNKNTGVSYIFRNIKVEEGPNATVWIPNKADTLYSQAGFGDKIEYDTSGYRNNGTIVGTIPCTSDTPRYSASMTFDGNCANYIKSAAPLNFLTNTLTVSCWIYQTATSSMSSGSSNSNPFIVSFGRDYEHYGFNLRSASGVPTFFIGGGATGNISVSSGVNVLNGWHMVTGVWDGATAKIYIDGVLKASKACAGVDYTHAGGAFVVGKMSYGHTSTTTYFPFPGKISDVRVYATALSDSDILELYNAPAAIDNMGNAFAMQLVEVI